VLFEGTSILGFSLKVETCNAWPCVPFEESTDCCYYFRKSYIISTFKQHVSLAGLDMGNTYIILVENLEGMEPRW
jgi:hypothetical protein